VLGERDDSGSGFGDAAVLSAGVRGEKRKNGSWGRGERPVGISRLVYGVKGSSQKREKGVRQE